MPKVAEDRRRSKRIVFLMRPSEYEVLELAAERAQEPVGEFCRVAVTRRALAVLDGDSLPVPPGSFP